MFCAMAATCQGELAPDSSPGITTDAAGAGELKLFSELTDPLSGHGRCTELSQPRGHSFANLKVYSNYVTMRLACTAR